MNLKLSNIDPDDFILAIRAAKSFVKEGKPVGIRHGTWYDYQRPVPAEWMDDGNIICLYVYQTKTMVVVRYSKS